MALFTGLRKVSMGLPQLALGRFQFNVDSSHLSVMLLLGFRQLDLDLFEFVLHIAY